MAEVDRKYLPSGNGSNPTVHFPGLPEKLHGLSPHHEASNEHGYAFFMPLKSLMGPGSLKGAGAAIKDLGYQKALIVADKPLVECGAMEPLKAELDKAGVTFALYTGAGPNPTAQQVHEGVDTFRSNGCDFIISFGGGSMHDAAKAVGIVIKNGGRVQDYEGVDKATQGMVPLVAVNTTAGTAAELTRFAIITDTERKVKMAIIDARCTPAIAVNDPTTMIGMPKPLTAATGMDALTHAIEAYVSTQSTPLTDAAALHAIRLISRYLIPAWQDGTDLVARDMMAYAEYLAGVAFNSAGLGYVHAIAHQLGGFYDAPHGVCNAVLLPVIQAYNAPAVPGLFADISEAMAIELPKGADGSAAAQAVLKKIKEMSKAMEIPQSIKELGAREEDFGVLAEHAMADPCGSTNPRQPSHAEVVELLRQAYQQTY